MGTAVSCGSCRSPLPWGKPRLLQWRYSSLTSYFDCRNWSSPVSGCPAQHGVEDPEVEAITGPTPCRSLLLLSPAQLQPFPLPPITMGLTCLGWGAPPTSMASVWAALPFRVPWTGFTAHLWHPELAVQMYHRREGPQDWALTDNGTYA